MLDYLGFQSFRNVEGVGRSALKSHDGESCRDGRTREFNIRWNLEDKYINTVELIERVLESPAIYVGKDSGLDWRFEWTFETKRSTRVKVSVL